jgi:hypothetical protein
MHLFSFVLLHCVRTGVANRRSWWSVVGIGISSIGRQVYCIAHGVLWFALSDESLQAFVANGFEYPREMLFELSLQTIAVRMTYLIVSNLAARLERLVSRHVKAVPSNRGEKSKPIPTTNDQ